MPTNQLISFGNEASRKVSENALHTGGVASSILAAPTIFPRKSATFHPGADRQIGRIRQLPADQSRNPAGESGENPGSGFARRSESPHRYKLQLRENAADPEGAPEPGNGVP
jgi:hypothetical protein